MYVFNAKHVEYSRAALEAMLAEGSLARPEKRKVERLLKMNDRRYARRMRSLTMNAGTLMFEGFETGFDRPDGMAADVAALEAAVAAAFGSFIEVVQNWINFFIENQDKIMAIINFIMKVIVPLFMISYAVPWFVLVINWMVNFLNV